MTLEIFSPSLPIICTFMANEKQGGGGNGACDPIVPLTARKQQGKGSRMSMNRPEIVVIMARADNGVIGREGKMPWHLPADLRRFKSLPQVTPMIMGRKKFVRLPGLLDDRRPILLPRHGRTSTRSE